MLTSTIVIVALAVAGQGEAAANWEAVTSQDGTFTVEMPAVPEQKGEVPIIAVGFSGVSGTQRETLRQSGRVTYMIIELEARGPIAKADQDKWMAVAASQAASRGGPGAKAVAGKPVQAGGVAGREFGVAGDPKFGAPPIIRGRIFLRGSRVAALVVIAGPSDKDLPPEADKFLGSFALADPAKVAADRAREKAMEPPPKFEAAQLVGVWEMVKSEEPKRIGSVLELLRDGRFKSTVKGQNITFTGNYKLKGDELIYTPPGFGATISELTATTMILDGNEYRRRGAAAAGPRGNARMGQGVGVRPRAGAAPDPASGGSGGRWPVVTSREDGFSVAMPGKPADEKQGGGGVGVHILTAQEGNLDLLIMAVTAPVEVPKDQEAKILGTLRERAVSTKFGAEFQVAADEPDKLGPLEGRRFDLTITRADIGKVKARGRSFARDKSAYVLLAVAREADAELPPDAAKFLDSFALSGIASGSKSVAISEGSSKGEERPGQNWGNPIDPDGDVTIRPSGRSLTIEIPGKAHVLAPERGKMNAPRVTSPVTGPFVATVRVEGKFRPARGSTVEGLSSRQAAGLIVWKNEQNYLVLQHRATADDGDARDQVVLEELVDGRKGATLRQPVGEGPLYLRLECQARRLVASYSVDGRSWKQLKPVEPGWTAGELQVGVVAVSTSPGPHEVVFDGLAIKKP